MKTEKTLNVLLSISLSVKLFDNVITGEAIIIEHFNSNLKIH